MKASRINILTALLSCALLIALLTFIMTTTVLRAAPEEVNKSPDVSSSSMAPGLVGTSTEPQDSVNSVQRKTFYADGLFWAFYAKDWMYLTYYTSPDGITWTVGASSPLETSDHLCGDDFSICFDGTYFHYVYAEEPRGTISGNVYYRRGIPNADGSITWSTPSHQTVLAGGGEWYFESVTVDSSGRPWITYGNYNNNSPPNVGYVTCSSTADGVWNTAAGFPYQLTSNGCTYIVPLTENKMYAYWLAEESQIYGKLWNGSSWGPQETVSSSLAEYETFASAVSDGDNISLVFLKSTGYDIIYVERTTSWSSETTVYAGANTDSAPVLSLDASNGNLYCFWALSPTANHIFYKKNIDGVWDSSPADWIDASSTGITYGRSINSFYQVLNGRIGLEYTTGSANPYDVRYAFLNVTMPASSFS